MDIVLIELTIAGLFYALFSVALQRRLSNVDKMYELKAKMNKHTKELMELSKKREDMSAISAKQKELTNISMESMKRQMKPMLVILPVLAVVFYYVIPTLFGASGISVNLLGFILDYRLFFIAVTFVLGIALSISFSIYDRRRLRHKYNFGLLQPSFKEDPDAQPDAQPKV